jgi:hypothetical protein
VAEVLPFDLNIQDNFPFQIQMQREVDADIAAMTSAQHGLEEAA